MNVVEGEVFASSNLFLVQLTLRVVDIKFDYTVFPVGKKEALVKKTESAIQLNEAFLSDWLQQWCRFLYTLLQGHLPLGLLTIYFFVRSPLETKMPESDEAEGEKLLFKELYFFLTF